MSSDPHNPEFKLSICRLAKTYAFEKTISLDQIFLQNFRETNNYRQQALFLNISSIYVLNTKLLVIHIAFFNLWDDKDID